MVSIKPNILFLVVDSLRADKCFGDSKTSKTPYIDSLIKNGIYFSQTISSAPSTILASSSILTGLYPFKALRYDRKHRKIFSNVVTYVGLLKDFGYHTYAAIPKAVSLLGLAKHFDDKYVPDIEDLILSTGFDQKIVEKLESKTMHEPWLFYIHVMDLHPRGQASLPEQFNNDKFGINQYERMLSSVDTCIGKILQTIQLEKTIVILTGDHGAWKGMHKPDIKFVDYINKKPLDFDTKIGNLVSNTFWFKSNLSSKLFFIRNIIGKFLRIPQNIIIRIRVAQIKRLKIPINEKRLLLHHVVADFEDLYDGTLRPPLVFSGYNVPKGVIIKQQIRSVDIFPTIADLIELTKRKDKIHGVSLAPYFHGGNMKELPARIESTPKWLLSIGKNAIGVRTSNYKYFRSIDKPKKDVHLFDLKNDPFEEKNIAKQYPALVQKMEKLLSELDNDYISTDELEDMNEETIGKIETELKKLGYI